MNWWKVEPPLLCPPVATIRKVDRSDALSAGNSGTGSHYWIWLKRGCDSLQNLVKLQFAEKLNFFHLCGGRVFNHKNNFSYIRIIWSIEIGSAGFARTELLLNTRFTKNYRSSDFTLFMEFSLYAVWDFYEFTSKSLQNPSYSTTITVGSSVRPRMACRLIKLILFWLRKLTKTQWRVLQAILNFTFGKEAAGASNG